MEIIKTKEVYKYLDRLKNNLSFNYQNDFLDGYVDLKDEKKAKKELLLAGQQEFKDNPNTSLFINSDIWYKNPYVKHVKFSDLKNKHFSYNEDKLNELEKFLLVLNENSSLSKDLSKGFDVMEEYIKDAIDASDDEKVLGMYDKEEHEEKVRLTRLRAAKREGLERGMEKGIAKGANDKQMEIAKNMFDKGIDIEMILECTGLSKEDIKIFK